MSPLLPFPGRAGGKGDSLTKICQHELTELHRRCRIQGRHAEETAFAANDRPPRTQHGRPGAQHKLRVAEGRGLVCQVSWLKTQDAGTQIRRRAGSWPFGRQQVSRSGM